MQIRKMMLVMLVILVSGWSVGNCSGYLFMQQGGRANGMAGAFVATANDASSIFYNPAGMSFMNTQQALIGANIYYQSGSFEGNSPITHQTILGDLRSTSFLMPSLYYVRPINDKITGGIGIFRFFNYDTEWKEREQFGGRFVSQRSYLSTWSFNPAIAYNVNSKLGIALGIELREIKFNYEKNIPLLIHQYDAIFDIAHLLINSKKEWGVSFNFGAMYLLSDDIRIGLSYRHGMEKNIDAEAEFNIVPISISSGGVEDTFSFPEGAVTVESNIVLPSVFSVGVAYQYYETLMIELDINWEKWDSMEELRFNFVDYPIYDMKIKKNYDNTFNVRLGLEKTLNSTYHLQAGYAFEKSPVSAAGIDPLYWDANRHNLSCGLTLKKENIAINIYNSLILHQKANTDGQNQFGLNGSYKKLINISGISLTYNW